MTDDAAVTGGVHDLTAACLWNAHPLTASRGIEDAVGVVVPTLNERDVIVETIERLLEHDVAEIVVSDGGSQDGTINAARAFAAVTVVEGAAGRGRQINAGLRCLRSPIAMIVHADTRLPEQAIGHVRRLLADPEVAGGCFRLSFDRPSVWLELYAALSSYESYWTTFGDQAFFFRRQDVDRVGGVADWPLFEDVDLRQRLLRLGRFEKLPLSVTTSARRFVANGPLRTQMMNALLLLGYRTGISPQRLTQFYRR